VTIAELWEEMGQTPAPPGAGQLLRRIHPAAVADLHVGLVKPGDQRLIAITVPHEHCPPEERLPSTRGTRSALGTPQSDGRIPIELRLVDPAAAEVFVALADDITSAAADADTHAGAAAAGTATHGRAQRGGPAWTLRRALDLSGADRPRGRCTTGGRRLDGTRARPTRLPAAGRGDRGQEHRGRPAPGAPDQQRTPAR
jgi:hypothetical protein